LFHYGLPVSQRYLLACSVEIRQGRARFHRHAEVNERLDSRSLGRSLLSALPIMISMKDDLIPQLCSIEELILRRQGQLSSKATEKVVNWRSKLAANYDDRQCRLVTPESLHRP
jgi:hypothetical protein